MKITLAPSHAPESGASAAAVNSTVCVEHPYDDLNVDETMVLVRQALIAYGFAEATVAEYFDASL